MNAPARHAPYTARAALASLGHTVTDEPREERASAWGGTVVTRWCRISPPAGRRIGAAGEGPDDASAAARLDDDLRAALRALLARAEGDVLDALASPRRGRAGVAAAESYRDRVRAAWEACARE